MIDHEARRELRSLEVRMTAIERRVQAELLRLRGEVTKQKTAGVVSQTQIQETLTNHGTRLEDLEVLEP